MTMRRKTFLVKAIDETKKSVAGYVSTFEWDRTRERFEKGAWKLDNFKANPVVLWAHDQGVLPIAKSVEIYEDDKGLMATTEFDTENPFAMQVFSLYKRGFLSSFSVGFRVNGYKIEEVAAGAKGIVFTNAELLEYSAVSVPANPGARLAKEEGEALLKAVPGLWVKSLETGEYEFETRAEEAQPELPAQEAPASEPAPEAAKEPENAPVEPPPAESAPVNPAPEAPKAMPLGLEATLKHLLDLCKMEKGQKTLGDGKLDLLKNVHASLGEFINDYSGEVSEEQIEQFKSMLNWQMETVKNLYGDPKGLVKKIMTNVDRALKSVAE